MTSLMDQYLLEATWSNKAADDIIADAIEGNIPWETESGLRSLISVTNPGNRTTDQIYIKLMALLLKDPKPKPIQAISVQLGYLSGVEDTIEAFKWGIRFIKAAERYGAYTLVETKGDWYVSPSIALSNKAYDKLAKLQYTPPMQVKPKDWTDNTNGGWLYDKKHLILGSKFTKHSKPQGYDAINKLQSIRWCIDGETYLTDRNTNRSINQKKFVRTVGEYLDKPFHFVWRFDSRGRSYSSGFELNLQSDEYGKALISLYDKEQITNIENLFVAIAGHAGKDKLTWHERINWVSGKDPEEIEWDEPILGRKAVRAYQDAMVGKDSGYTMSLDATSSGIQIMAVITGCKKTAKMVNCTDPTKRYDLYTEVTDRMNQQLMRPVNRKVIKQSTMTH